jgi:CRISPR/Cas system Type II protein with McrA/HNH and RuvC-like nuclease domain
MQPENHNYTMWMTTEKVFPHNKPNITEHNLILLKQFYLRQQHKHYQGIIERNFHQKQSNDTRYIQEPLQLPLVQIYLKECNPDTDINTIKPTIQIIQDKALIFTNKGNHLITISKLRLEWLWNQYNTNSNLHHQLDLPHQPFKTQVI